MDYELVLITPDGEKAKKVIDELTRSILQAKGEIGKVDEWGVRQLAYPIKKYTQANYFLLEISLPGEEVSGVNTILRVHDDVVRHLLLKKDSKRVKLVSKVKVEKEKPVKTEAKTPKASKVVKKAAPKKEKEKKKKS